MEKIIVWQVQAEKLVNISRTNIDFEKRLEAWLIDDLPSLFPGLCFLGNQVVIRGSKIDILAIDEDGMLTIIELKRNQTTRDTIAQALDYASILSQATPEELTAAIINDNGSEQDITTYLSNKYKDKNWEDFDLIEAKSNASISVVGTDIDDATIRIVDYLQSKNINIEAVAFCYFKSQEGCEFLAKSYYSPEATEESSRSKKERIVLSLFKSNKITVGDKFYYWPATLQGIDKNDNRICVTIEREGTRCLKREGDDKLYSFSKLRKMIIEDLNIEGVKPNWGFGIKKEWKLVLNDKSLEELLE